VSPWRTVRLVTVREVRTKGGTRGYLLGTGLLLLLVVAGIVVPTLLAGDPPTERTLAVVGDAPEDLGAQLDALLDDGVTTEVTVLGDVATARAAVADGEVDAALVDGRQLLREGPAGPTGDDLETALGLALQRAATAEALDGLGLTEEQAATLLTPAPPLERVDVGEDGSDAGGDAFVVAIALTVLLFLGIQLNGASVLTGALEEKSNRVVEVLVSVARPWQLLTGKLLGMSLLAIVQIGVVVAGALGANAAVQAFELPPATPALVGVSVVMLIAGFLFYASLYAVAGSLASSLEDAQSSAAPLGFLLTGAYFAVFIVVLPSPNSTASQILSFVPPTAPFVLPARMGLGGVPTWQASLAIGVTLVAALVTVRLAGRLYASSLLAGGKLSWREAWRGEPVR
jgi:ABC-2 type transport system permease protein